MDFSKIKKLNREKKEEKVDNDILKKIKIKDIDKNNKSDNKDEKNKDSETVMKDYFAETEKDLDLFEEMCWKKGDGYKLPGFPILTEKIEGLENGLYILAAESNMGKSAVLQNLLYDISVNCPENNLFGLYVSLDDSKEIIMSRTIASLVNIPISVASKPKRYKNLIDEGKENSIMYKEFLEKRIDGIKQLKNNKNMFKIIDSEKIKNIRDLREYIENILIYIKTINPKMNLALGIDSMCDIIPDVNITEGAREDYIAQEVKQMTVDYKIPIFGTYHFKKTENNKRPVLNDVKGNNRIIFESNLTWLIYNDVSKNNQAANIYYYEQDETEKLPVIEMHWAKNKVSSFKGRTFCHFYPNFSKLYECTAEEIDLFNSRIFEDK